MFRRKPRIAEPYHTWIEELIAEQRAAGHRWYGFEPKGSAAGRQLMAASPEEQRGFVARQVAERVLEYLERLRVADGNFERLVSPRVDHTHAQPVVERVPEERDLEPFGAAMCEFLPLHGPIVPLGDNGPITAS